VTAVRVNLFDICKPKQWPVLSAAEMSESGFPVFGANGRIGFSDTYTHEHPVLLVGCRGSCGTLHVTPPRSYANGNAMALDSLDTSRVALEYLVHFLRWRGFRDVVSGSSQPQITQTTLRRIEVPLPPLAEQKRIAAVLDKADDLRGKRRQALATLDTLLHSVFLDMFGDPVTNPKGWPVRRLGDECDVRDGTHDSPEYVAKGVPLVTSKNLRNGRVDLDEAQLISEEDYEQICRRSRVHRGDIIMPMIGTIGNPVLVEDDPHYAIKNVALIKFVPASPVNTYVRMLLAGSFLDSMKSRSAKGGTQQFISLGDIRSFPIPLPPLSLQREWNVFYMRSRGFMAVMTKHRDSLDTLFATLQSAAFAGTLFNGEVAKAAASKSARSTANGPRSS
jgi:type I restriction enzyme S subunit